MPTSRLRHGVLWRQNKGKPGGKPGSPERRSLKIDVRNVILLWCWAPESKESYFKFERKQTVITEGKTQKMLFFSAGLNMVFAVSSVEMVLKVFSCPPNKKWGN